MEIGILKAALAVEFLLLGKCLISRNIVPVSLQKASSMHSLAQFAQFTDMSRLRISGQRLSLSGSGSNFYLWACVCMFMCMHGYTRSGHSCTTCAHYMWVFFSALSNVAEALETSSGSRMELVGRIGSWLQDQPQAHVDQLPASSHMHAWENTRVSAQLSVGKHVCFMGVSWWVKHLSRTSGEQAPMDWSWLLSWCL